MKSVNSAFLIILIIFSTASIPCYADASMNDAVLVSDPVELAQAGYPDNATYVYRSTDGGYFELRSEHDTPSQEKPFGTTAMNYYSIPGPLFLADEQTIDLDKNSTELSCSSLSGGAFFYAPVRLPSGVKITKLEYFGRDSIASHGNIASLRRACQTTNVADPELDLLSPEIGSTVAFDAGNFYASSDLVETVDNRNCAYHVGVQFVGGCSGFIRLYKVRIQWQRQISAAPAVATFTDVPTSHPFFQSIEAMVAAGITGGIGGGQYGPDQTLTRGQMAAFLSRALGL